MWIWFRVCDNKFSKIENIWNEEDDWMGLEPRPWYTNISTLAEYTRRLCQESELFGFVGYPCLPVRVQAVAHSSDFNCRDGSKGWHFCHQVDSLWAVCMCQATYICTNMIVYTINESSSKHIGYIIYSHKARNMQYPNFIVIHWIHLSRSFMKDFAAL